MSNSESKRAHPPLIGGPALRNMLAQSQRIATLNTSEKTLVDPYWVPFEAALKNRLLAAAKHFGHSSFQSGNISLEIYPHNPTAGHRKILGDYEDMITISVAAPQPKPPHYETDFEQRDALNTKYTHDLRETLARADGMAMAQSGRAEPTRMHGTRTSFGKSSYNSFDVSLKTLTQLLNAVPCEHPLLDLPEAPFCSVYTHIGNPERLGR